MKGEKTRVLGLGDVGLLQERSSHSGNYFSFDFQMSINHEKCYLR